MTKPKKNKKIKAWAVITYPMPGIAHCMCHSGAKMLMISLERKGAESFRKCLGLLKTKIKEIEITIKSQ